MRNILRNSLLSVFVFCASGAFAEDNQESVSLAETDQPSVEANIAECFYNSTKGYLEQVSELAIQKIEDGTLSDDSLEVGRFLSTELTQYDQGPQDLQDCLSSVLDIAIDQIPVVSSDETFMDFASQHFDINTFFDEVRKNNEQLQSHDFPQAVWKIIGVDPS